MSSLPETIADHPFQLYFKIYDSFAVYFGIHLCWAGTILVFLYYYLSEINWEVVRTLVPIQFVLP